MNRASNSLDSFKAQLSLADIVGRYMRLTKQGREFKGLCPFHQEKSPSFSVVEDKGFYHCFGCGAHGDAIGFVMEMDNLAFPEALERITELTGVEAPRAERGEGQDQRKRLVTANEAAAMFFSQQLGSPVGRATLDYLASRGVTASDVKAFSLGFAPDSRGALRQSLNAQGFADKELLEAGLLAAHEDASEPYDRFRNRLIFPIHDARGSVVAFGGRTMSGHQAKYLNSPDTSLFHKGRLLYNLHRASAPARKIKRIVLVEGYLDVIAMARFGYPYTVAPLGTAATEEQLQLLWRQCDTPVVCLDGDKAGVAAAIRLIKRALPIIKAGQGLAFAMLPQDEDPDSFLGKSGERAMQELIDHAAPMSQLIWQSEQPQTPLETPEQISALRRRLRDYVQLAGDRGLRQDLGQLYRERIDVLWQSRRAARTRPLQNPGKKPARQSVGAARLASSLRAVSGSDGLLFLSHFLRRPTLISEYEESLGEIEFPEKRLNELRDEIFAWYAEADTLDAEGLRSHLHRYGFSELMDRVPREAKAELESDALRALGSAIRNWQTSSRRRKELGAYASALRPGAESDLTAMRLSVDRLLNSEGEADDSS